jgi:phospholipase C
MRMLRTILFIALTACGDDTTPPPGMDAAVADSGFDASRDSGFDTLPPITRIPESEAAAGREACMYARGAFPWQTIGEEFPIGDDIPIDHIIVVLQENRSFDHYFGTMPGVDGIPMDASNPDTDGTPIEPYHETEYCIEDVAHSWNASWTQFNMGANDGFVTTNNPNGRRAMGYFTDADLPFYWNIYQTFAMSDHHHCSLLGPTWPNRMYLYSASSGGRIRNVPFPEAPRPELPYIIMQMLESAGVEWAIYKNDLPFALGGYLTWVGGRLGNIREFSNFESDLAGGAMPSVVFVDPAYGQGELLQTDEHPPANPQDGQRFIWELITTVMQSPIWPRTALILSYDEHGGFYDHVPPPEACDPGDFPPEIPATGFPGTFTRLGFRVPLLVVSPYSRPGYVSDRVTDLSSITRFIETRYLLPAMTGRDANAWPLLDMFDFTTPAFMDPPEFPEPPVDAAQSAACRAAFP